MILAKKKISVRLLTMLAPYPDKKRPTLSQIAMWLKFMFKDHGLIRIFWDNFEKVAPGCYRGNQPGPWRLKKYANMGIRTIINLRGERSPAYNLFEKPLCEELGLSLIDMPFHARQAVTRKRFLMILEVLKSVEGPFLLHCKSGADRSGLVAALYLTVVQGEPIAIARKQLSWRYAHISFSKAGVQDYVLRVFEERQLFGFISFEDWIRAEYNPKVLQTGWDSRLDAKETARNLQLSGVNSHNSTFHAAAPGDLQPPCHEAAIGPRLVEHHRGRME